MIYSRSDITVIKELNNLLHDKWFHINNVTYEENSKIFKLIYGDQKGIYDKYLEISDVLCCKINDTERVGAYDIYNLYVDTKNKQITINGCIPIKIILDVTENFKIITGLINIGNN
jgi:hypothetical protein